jgi:hypothetical protein
MLVTRSFTVFGEIVALPVPALRALHLARLLPSFKSILWKRRQTRYRQRTEGDMVRGANRNLLKSIGAAAQPR